MVRSWIFKQIWQLGLKAYDELKGINRKWQLDGCMVKSPLGNESVGKNPTDRGKNGTKRSVLVKKTGITFVDCLEQTLMT